MRADKALAEVREGPVTNDGVNGVEKLVCSFLRKMRGIRQLGQFGGTCQPLAHIEVLKVVYTLRRSPAVVPRVESQQVERFSESRFPELRDTPRARSAGFAS